MMAMASSEGEASTFLLCCSAWIESEDEELGGSENMLLEEDVADESSFRKTIFAGTGMPSGLSDIIRDEWG